jgi:hypothetical protein
MLSHLHRSSRLSLILFAVIAAAFCVSLPGCSTPLARWQTSMAVYTAAVNAAADLYDAKQIDQEQLLAFREAGRIARAALDRWVLTISPDGNHDDGAARATAEGALDALRRWLARVYAKK